MALTPTTTTNPQPAFEPGDRVQERYGWPQHGRDGESLIKRHGLITAVHPGKPNGKGAHGWLFDVLWDGDPQLSKCHLASGLVRVMVLPPVMLIGGAYSEKS